MERAERIVLLCIGLLFEPLLVPVLWVMLVLTGDHCRPAVRQGVEAGRGRAGDGGADRAAPPPAPEPQGRPDRATPHAASRAGRPDARTGRMTERAGAAGDTAGSRARRRRDHASAASAPARDRAGAARIRRRRPGHARSGSAPSFANARTAGDDRAPPAAGQPARGRAAGARRRCRRRSTRYARYYIESFRLPVAVEATRRRAASSSTASHHVTDALDRGNGRDPRAAAPRRLGVGRALAGRPRLQDDRRGRAARAARAVRVVRRPAQGARHERGAARPDAGAAVLRALQRATRSVCLLCDRDIERGGVEVEFFGERTTLPAGPATLSLRTGAPILPVGVYFTGGSTATTPSCARRSRRAPAASCATTSRGSRSRSPTSSSSSSAAHPSSGTSSNRTGRQTRVMGKSPARRHELCCR